MLRKIVPLVLILLMFMASTCWPMGGGVEEDAPELDQDIRVELTDASGMAVELNQVKIDGRAAFSGNLGNAVVTIPFAKLIRTEFMVKSNDCKAIIWFKDGQQLNLNLKRTSQLVGQASFGKYRINLGQIMRIRFLP